MSNTFQLRLNQEDRSTHFAYILLQRKPELGKEFEKAFDVKFGINQGGVLTFNTSPQNEQNVRSGFSKLLTKFVNNNTHLTKEDIQMASHTRNGQQSRQSQRNDHRDNRSGGGYRGNGNDNLRGNFGDSASQGFENRAPYKFEAKTEGQAVLKSLIESNDITFGLGPAGTGKTHVAVAVAVDMLNKKQVEKILLARPAQEAGEKLGYLPGDQKQKLDPYMRPLYDEMTKVMGKEKLDRLMSSGVIEIVPVGLMRGRTFENAFIILDEAQNATKEQTEMALTRFGNGSKMVLTGDPAQTDISKDSGLKWAAEALKGTEGIGQHQFSNKDIIRHPVVERVVSALDKVKAAAAALAAAQQEPQALDKPKAPAAAKPPKNA
ncbi:MAG: PhoH family protein [Alphaproteobacteria bacterium]|nr:PhoH family protein [Alphaproteobacteria bacterium]HRI75431.1 PhoH family protein [Alphaproteobacteria bacterium]